MLLAEADEARPPRFFLPLPLSSWSPKPSVGVSGRVSEYRRLRAESVKAPPSVGGLESEGRRAAAGLVDYKKLLSGYGNFY